LSFRRDDFGVGVKNSELVVFGDIDKCHFRVVEDRVIVDGLDPIKVDVVENFLDVVFHCGVADILQFGEKNMAVASLKASAVRSGILVKRKRLGNKLGQRGRLGLAVETDSRQVSFCGADHLELTVGRAQSQKVCWHCLPW
jgi:hypothetical protein